MLKHGAFFKAPGAKNTSHRSDRLFKGSSLLHERHMFAIAHTFLYYKTGFCEEHSDEAISQGQTEFQKRTVMNFTKSQGRLLHCVRKIIFQPLASG